MKGSSSIRRRAFLRLGLAVVLAGVLTAASPAQAQCPGDDGTLPGSQASVVTVATPAATVYVDDRDYLDLDEDDDAGGLRVYLESNGTDGLQRGGFQAAFAVLDDHGLNPRWPWINPIWIVVPVPVVGPIQYTLFPNGWYPRTVAEFVGMHDRCIEASDPDTLLL